MKKQTTYYVIGAVLIGVGVYLYYSNNNDKKNVNLNPPMIVTEVENGVVTTTTTETATWYNLTMRFKLHETLLLLKYL